MKRNSSNSTSHAQQGRKGIREEKYITGPQDPMRPQNSSIHSHGSNHYQPFAAAPANEDFSSYLEASNWIARQWDKLSFSQKTAWVIFHSSATIATLFTGISIFAKWEEIIASIQQEINAPAGFTVVDTSTVGASFMLTGGVIGLMTLVVIYQHIPSGIDTGHETEEDEGSEGDDSTTSNSSRYSRTYGPRLTGPAPHSKATHPTISAVSPTPSSTKKSQ